MSASWAALLRLLLLFRGVEAFSRALLHGHHLVGGRRSASTAHDVSHSQFHVFLCLADDITNCRQETLRVLAVASLLCVLIFFSFCAYCSMREDKEEHITPLCPQLVVRRSDLNFQMKLDEPGRCFKVVECKDPENVVCKVLLDWPDPKLGGQGLVATAQLQSATDSLLATIVVRHVSDHGQALALCRSSCEIFAFVEQDCDNRYLVRHRSNIPLLAMIGDFDSWDVDGVNPVGAKVCSLKRSGDTCDGKVQQHVDAGLVICSFLVSYIHRLLTRPATVCAPPAFGFGLTNKTDESKKSGEAAGLGCEDTAAEPGEKLVLPNASEALPAGDPFASSSAVPARDVS
jgi:hypothetical protein